MRLIDADALFNSIFEFRRLECCMDNFSTADGLYIAQTLCNDAPTIDAAPVVHGEWMQEFISKDIYCSNCKREIWTKEEFESLFDLYKSYCPCCGAKMD